MFKILHIEYAFSGHPFFGGRMIYEHYLTIKT